MKTPSTRHHRRSPRLVAAADATDDKPLAANGMTMHTLQETTRSKHQQSSSSTRRCSPRLQQDYNDNTTAAQEENWNQTNFHPYKPSPPQQEAYSIYWYYSTTRQSQGGIPSRRARPGTSCCACTVFYVCDSSIPRR